MTRSVACLLALVLLALPAGVGAEEEPEFMQHFFTPELIMNNARAIDLTKEQRGVMLKELQRVQALTTETQWGILEAAERLNELSQAETVSESAMIEAAREVFAAETRLKESHLGLLVRLRNALTPAQREKLTAIRDDG